MKTLLGLESEARSKSEFLEHVREWVQGRKGSASKTGTGHAVWLAGRAQMLLHDPIGNEVEF